METKDGDRLRQMIADFDEDENKNKERGTPPSRRKIEMGATILSGDILDKLNLENVDFTRAQLYGTSLIGSTLFYTSFIGANLDNARLDEINFNSQWPAFTNFSYARMMSARIIGANLQACNFKYAYLDKSKIIGTNLEGSLFINTVMQAAECDGSNLQLTQFRNCDLTRVSFRGANLRNASFINCNLTGADFTHADMIDTKFEGVDLFSCNIREWNPALKTYDIAISFAGEDRKIAETIATQCRKNGLSVFFTNPIEPDLIGKDMYQYFFDIYSRKATFAIILISKHYVSKPWTKHELKAAQSRQFESEREYILPVMLDDTDAAAIPKTMGYLDGKKVGSKTLADAICKKVIQYKAGK